MDQAGPWFTISLAAEGPVSAERRRQLVARLRAEVAKQVKLRSRASVVIGAAAKT
jgi:hypothetical protein